MQIHCRSSKCQLECRKEKKNAICYNNGRICLIFSIIVTLGVNTLEKQSQNVLAKEQRTHTPSSFGKQYISCSVTTPGVVFFILDIIMKSSVNIFHDISCANMSFPVLFYISLPLAEARNECCDISNTDGWLENKIGKSPPLPVMPARCNICHIIGIGIA